MADVAEWPKWLNDIITKLDASSSGQGPSAVHGPALITPTLRKQLRDICIELHHVHLERSASRAWGVYVVTGPSADTWCQHTVGKRIEVDERTARTIALLFTERFHHQYTYEARRLG